MKQNSIFTNREVEVIKKKLKGERLTQQDSNYLSRYVRPKLKGISSINASLLLEKLEYNQKTASIERKIKKLILKHIGEVDSIVLYGSAVQTNWKDYKDVDVLVVVKRIFWGKLSEKYRKISEIKKEGLKNLINLDIEIYDKKTLGKNYPHSPTLIYQLKDSKIIYGKLEITNKIKIHNIDLKMKLDYSDILETKPLGLEIYKALRNIILVRLILKGIIDNIKLKAELDEEVGKNLVERLKNGRESRIDRKIALIYLKNLLEKTENDIKGDLWERIELSKV